MLVFFFTPADGHFSVIPSNPYWLLAACRRKRPPSGRFDTCGNTGSRRPLLTATSLTPPSSGHSSPTGAPLLSSRLCHFSHSALGAEHPLSAAPHPSPRSRSSTAFISCVTSLQSMLSISSHEGQSRQSAVMVCINIHKNSMNRSSRLHHVTRLSTFDSHSGVRCQVN